MEVARQRVLWLMDSWMLMARDSSAIATKRRDCVSTGLLICLQVHDMNKITRLCFQRHQPSAEAVSPRSLFTQLARAHLQLAILQKVQQLLLLFLWRKTTRPIFLACLWRIRKAQAQPKRGGFPLALPRSRNLGRRSLQKKWPRFGASMRSL